MRFKPQTNFLNRFTTLPILLDMLSRRCITLLEPKSWEDRNDAYYLEKYKAEKKLKTLVAYCFTTKRETFHHWKVFSDGLSGVCIEFNSAKLLSEVGSIEGTSYREVSYRLIKHNQNPSLGGWPFLKRIAFADEGEFRIIYENQKIEGNFQDIQIDLDCINKITLSPWLPKPIVNSITKVIHDIEGCGTIKVISSSLLDSIRWKDCIWGSE